MKWLGYFGKFLISVGVGVLLFVGWTLWGTGIYTRQQQEELAQRFDDQPLFRIDPEDQTPGPPNSFKPRSGDPVFRMRIPRLERTYMVVEGVGTEDLAKGPGHYPECRPGFPPPLCTSWDDAFPGEDGRVVVSGHRTTYDAPFENLDRMKEGDEILTDTKWGDFTYEVTRIKIVPSGDLTTVIPSSHPELVLTTCNPKYSAAERLVVFAELVV